MTNLSVFMWERSHMMGFSVCVCVLQERRNLPFMQELRNLFSLMVGSNRKYVDPSRAVEILQEAFQSSESQQVNTYTLTHFKTSGN